MICLAWWRAHHFIATVATGILLTWPESQSYHSFRTQFFVFSFYLSFVQVRYDDQHSTRAVRRRVRSRACSSTINAVVSIDCEHWAKHTTWTSPSKASIAGCSVSRPTANKSVSSRFVFRRPLVPRAISSCRLSISIVQRLRSLAFSSSIHDSRMAGAGFIHCFLSSISWQYSHDAERSTR
jgi:hypothetical protein